MAATGAAPRPLVARAHWADWSPDGQLAVVRIVDGAYRLEFPIGRVLRQVARPGFIGHVRFSPAGDSIAFLEQSDGSYSLKTVTLDGTVRTIVDRLGISFGLAWMPDGREIWYTSYDGASPFALFAADLSGRTRLLQRSPGGIMVMDIARDGRVLAASYDYRVTAMAKLTGDTDERDYSVFNNAHVAELSADGRALLLMDRPHGGSVRVGAYIRRQDAPAPVRLFDGPTAFALSPDGTAVLRTVRPEGGLQLVPVGAGESRTILASSSIVWEAAEFPRLAGAVLATGAPPGRPLRCYLQTPGAREPKAVTPEGVEQCDISPDGQFVVAASRDPEVRLALYASDGSPPRNVSGAVAGDIPIRWAADARTLYVRAPGTVPARVFTIDLPTGRRQPWRSLIPADPAGVFDVDNPLIAADADSYAYSYSRFLFDLYQIEGLR
jgi:eukaryotic-like serine/threonine-protein kinase